MEEFSDLIDFGRYVGGNDDIGGLVMSYRVIGVGNVVVIINWYIFVSEDGIRFFVDGYGFISEEGFVS